MKKVIIIVVLVLVAAGATLGAFGYFKLLKKSPSKGQDIYVATGSDYESLKKQLLKEGIIDDEIAFDFTAQALRYGESVKPGKYEIKKGISMLNLVRKLRAGDVGTVNVTFHNVRTLEAVAGRVATYIEADSVELLNAFNDSTLWLGSAVGETEFCNLIPNTYDFFWNTSGEEFVLRMKQEAEKFWNDDRLAKAAEMDMSPCEIVNLAAIVQEEQSGILSEQPTIAGLYYNRLRRNMLLQADPTLKYVAGDFSIKRLLNYHKELESPYNTYKYAGLPPSPIVIPEPGAIDAVLDHEEHSYLYMCAKEDFSGEHNFAKTLRQHNINARRYQRALSAEMRRARNNN